MYELILIGKFISLLFTIMYGLAYIGRVIRSQAWSDAQGYILGIAAAGFITLQWLI